MKRTIAVIFAFVLAFSLTACGGAQENQNTAANSIAEESVQSFEPEAAQEPSAAEEPSTGEPVAESAVEMEQTSTVETEQTSTDEAEAGPAARSSITSVADVPLLTLNNGVQMPQLGLGTQIQSLERDATQEGRQLLNDTSHDAVVAALQAGYRHLDTAHGYFNEQGVGQGIIDSGVPREEIWLTSKLWPSEYGEGVTMQAIDDILPGAGF